MVEVADDSALAGRCRRRGLGVAACAGRRRRRPAADPAASWSRTDIPAAPGYFLHLPHAAQVRQAIDHFRDGSAIHVGSPPGGVAANHEALTTSALGEKARLRATGEESRRGRAIRRRRGKQIGRRNPLLALAAGRVRAHTPDANSEFSSSGNRASICSMPPACRGRSRCGRGRRADRGSGGRGRGCCCRRTAPWRRW